LQLSLRTTYDHSRGQSARGRLSRNHFAYAYGRAGQTRCTAKRGAPHHIRQNFLGGNLQMKRIQTFFAALAATACMALAPAANAQTISIKVVAAGSPALFQPMGVAAFNDLAGANAHHYTIGGSGCASGNCAQMRDQRATIPNEGGNLWVVWSDPAVSPV